MLLRPYKLKRISAFFVRKPIELLPVVLTLVIAGCSLEKQSGFNRSMQNLTAHYNILFNAKETLRLKQESYAATFIDDYNEILSVYPDTIAQGRAADKDLESAIVRANTIINIKEQSHYIGDAYEILGQAYYLEGNYFNAGEYFSYVINDFPKEKELVQEARTWKARTLMYLDQLPKAKAVLDTAFTEIDPKKKPPANIFAAKLQYDINVQEYADAEKMAEQAVEHSDNRLHRLRWTFILAQLQELNQKNGEALKNYTQIAKSNASFEMAFNASLNRIRIEDNLNGVKISRIDRLRGLLKDPNNKEFTDQIYYQIAQLQMVDKDIDGAIKNYRQSVRHSVKNQAQKGLSYLRLAEIYFNNKADYLQSKKYYDSTLTSLPVSYPGYKAIQKKGSNLQILADRLQTIAREDTLQALAKMDEKTRAAVIDKMVNDKILQQQALANAASANVANNTPGGVSTSGGAGSFYFYNSNAVGQGVSDFKQKWGNRKLEDNWRRAARAESDITNNQSLSTQGIDPDAPAAQAVNRRVNANAGNYRQELVQGLPLTPQLLAQSNLRIYNAYVDIANFYRDILEDKKQAIAQYELILKLYPNDNNKPAIYYNLYRLYGDVDPAKADQFKNLLLNNFAETPFARIIADPEYAQKLNNRDAEFTQAYNVVFDLYSHRQYNDVLQCVPELLKQYPGNKFSAQLYYLQTIAAGHYEKVGPFTDSLKAIVAKYPADKLVTPLINQHLAYINANLAEMQTRPVVLANDNPNDIPFTNTGNQEQDVYRKPGVKFVQVIQTPVKRPDEIKPATAARPNISVARPPVATLQAPAPVAVAIPTPATAQVVPKAVDPDAPLTATTTHPSVTTALPDKPVIKKTSVSSIFSMRDTAHYYFVVNVSSGTTNLASSRFGIGQFNRTNYAGKGIRHMVLPVAADNQLIYVGEFSSLDIVKKYATALIPLLPDIMKVPKDKYSFFIISKENLDKLADRKLLDSYYDFYQQNF